LLLLILKAVTNKKYLFLGTQTTNLMHFSYLPEIIQQQYNIIIDFMESLFFATLVLLIDVLMFWHSSSEIYSLILHFESENVKKLMGIMFMPISTISSCLPFFCKLCLVANYFMQLIANVFVTHVFSLFRDVISFPEKKNLNT
jgi:hypothetical protein